MPIPEVGEQNYCNDAMHPQGEVRKGTPLPPKGMRSSEESGSISNRNSNNKESEP
jgi:hypothetical protein